MPDVAAIARRCLARGAHGVTLHPRPDQRHARDEDVRQLAALVQQFPGAELNVEGNPTDRYLDLVLAARPAQATLVPDAPAQLTSDHGWDAVAERAAAVGGGRRACAPAASGSACSWIPTSPRSRRRRPPAPIASSCTPRPTPAGSPRAAGAEAVRALRGGGPAGAGAGAGGERRPRPQSGEPGAVAGGRPGRAGGVDRARVHLRVLRLRAGGDGRSLPGDRRLASADWADLHLGLRGPDLHLGGSAEGL